MTRTRRALWWMLALALLAGPVEHLLAVLLPDVSLNPLPASMAGAAVTLLMLGAPAWRLRPWTSPRMPCSKSVWLGVCLGAAVGLLGGLSLPRLNASWQAWLGVTAEGLVIPEGLLAMALYALLLAAVPAITEEIFFRGALLAALMDGARRGTALLLTALFFTLMHDPTNWPGLLALSILLTLLMSGTGRIVGPITAHFLFNLTALVGGRIPLWGSLLAGAGLIGLGGYLSLRQPKVAHRPMEQTDGLIGGAVFLVLLARYIV